jgi:hypothetical protein
MEHLTLRCSKYIGDVRCYMLITPMYLEHLNVRCYMLIIPMYLERLNVRCFMLITPMYLELGGINM